MSVEVTFCGAAGMVTGSCYHVKHAGGSFLVDCGMFQGNKSIRELNYGNFPFTPSEPSCLLLTHAHIDHCGLIPKLVASGFEGPIYATAGTADLLTYVLPDSGHIQEMEVEHLNWRNARRGLPRITPIYTRAEAVSSLRFLKNVGYCDWFEVAAGVRARYWDAGHILGSASIEIEIAQTGNGDEPLTLLFSGDLGPGDKSFHPDPTAPTGVDYLFVETTYGDRDRPDETEEQRRQLLRAEVQAALAAGGNLLIPAFAVERTQELLVDLDMLMDSREIPAMDIFLDSPLAIEATAVFEKHLKEIIHNGTAHPFRRNNLHFVNEAAESRKLERLTGGSIIIAGSGMCDAGRIRHHLKNNLWRPETTVLLVGYQAPGTLGRLLLEGKKQVRIQGEEIAVRARIRSLDSFSGHADRQNLLKWIKARLPVAQEIFLMHGEDSTRQHFLTSLNEQGWTLPRIHSPRLGETIALRKLSAAPQTSKSVRPLPKVPGQLDWHNAYADIIIALTHKLHDLEDDRKRETLLATLRETIEKSGAKDQPFA
jgi:metallo-beta-lactamase family protein